MMCSLTDSYCYFSLKWGFLYTGLHDFTYQIAVVILTTLRISNPMKVLTVTKHSICKRNYYNLQISFVLTNSILANYWSLIRIIICVGPTDWPTSVACYSFCLCCLVTQIPLLYI